MELQYPSRKRKATKVLRGTPQQRLRRILAAAGQARAVPSLPALRVRRALASKETGFVDLALANYALDTTGSVTLLATIPQGTTVSTRVGKKAMLLSLQGRGHVQSGTTTTLVDCAFLIVYDSRPQTTLPAITDILNTAHTSSMNNDANSGRFRILKRMDFSLSGNATAPATGGEIASSDFFLKIRRPIVFKAAGTGVIADIEEGALYLVTVGSVAAGTTAGILSMAFRTRFIDT